MRKLHAAMLIVTLGIGAAPAIAQDRPKNTEEASRQDKEKCFNRCAASVERDAKAGTIKEGVLKLSMDEVRTIQQALGKKGYNIAEVDGTLNDQTVAALKAFQKADGLRESGDFDLPTLNALGFDAAIFMSKSVKGSELAHAEMQRVQAGTVEHPGVGVGDHERMSATEVPAGMPIDVNSAGSTQDVSLGYIVLGESQIKSIQKRLKDEKYYTGETDGAITSEFIVGLRTFQTAKTIRSNGLIDFATLAAIPEVKITVEQTKKLDHEKIQEKGK